MEWIKVPTDEILFSERSDWQNYALIKYMALYCQLEVEPSVVQLRRVLNKKELDYVLSEHEVVLKLIESCIEVASKKRQRDKTRYSNLHQNDTEVTSKSHRSDTEVTSKSHRSDTEVTSKSHQSYDDAFEKKVNKINDNFKIPLAERQRNVATDKTRLDKTRNNIYITSSKSNVTSDCSDNSVTCDYTPTPPHEAIQHAEGGGKCGAVAVAEKKKNQKVIVESGKFYIDDSPLYCPHWYDLAQKIPRCERDKLCAWFFDKFEDELVDVSFVRNVLKKKICEVNYA